MRVISFLLRPVERWVQKIVRTEMDERPTVVKVDRVEVAADDPERFMRALAETIDRNLRS